MQRGKLVWVGLYAVAMAYVESAAVVYLRRVFGIVDLLRDAPPWDPAISPVELGRELATLIMLLAVGWAVGRTWQSRLGFACFAFGVWDVCYYLWLRLFIGWPDSLLAPDLLFLIPLPWWGPVIAPVLIACLSAVGGALAVFLDDQGCTVRPGPWQGTALGLGGLAVLYAFMADALAALPASAEALGRLRPGPFRWPPYLVGLVLMTGSVLGATLFRRRGDGGKKRPPSPVP